MDYSYIDVTDNKEHVVVWCRDMSGKLIKKEYPIEDFLYCFTISNTGETGYKDIYGAPLRKVSFKDKWEMRDYRNSHDDLCESDVQPSYKALLDMFADAPSNAPYNVLYYDIENDFDLSDGRGYPLPSNPFAPINSFQFYDSNTKTYGLVYVCDKPFKEPVDPDGGEIELIKCRDERDLILTIANLLDVLDVDIMTGWNVDGYDLPMIMARASILFGESQAKTMFCRNGFPARKREYVDDFGGDAVKWTLVGRQHLDMMELYKKFIPSEKKSFSLSNVCTEDLGVDKVNYDGDLGELYRENPEKFFEYAFWDAKLLRMLDEKHEIIRLAVTLARMNCVKPSDVTGAVKPIESGIMKYAHKDGVMLPDKKDNSKEKFEGAIVYDTVAGRHGWVSTIDLNQLYPATLMMLGLSPDTMIMELDDGYDDYVRVMSKSDDIIGVRILDRGVEAEYVEIKASELESIIRENGYTVSAAGIVFSGEFGFLARYVKYVTDQRSVYKNKMKEAMNANNKYEYELNNLYQKVIKILANSIYGCSGEVSFRLFDLRLSRSITLTARIISKWQAWKGNDVINQLKEE